MNRLSILLIGQFISVSIFCFACLLQFLASTPDGNTFELHRGFSLGIPFVFYREGYLTQFFLGAFILDLIVVVLVGLVLGWILTYASRLGKIIATD